jgi:hypothetical protein
MNNHHDPDLRCERDTKHRTVTPDSVVTANPEVILASWCGRRVDKNKICARALTEGVRLLHAILAGVVNCEPAEGLEPSEPLDPDILLRRTPAREGAAREEIPT